MQTPKPTDSNTPDSKPTDSKPLTVRIRSLVRSGTLHYNKIKWTY